MAYNETPTKGKNMNETIQSKINSTKTFVNTHKTAIAFAAGVVGGVTAAVAARSYMYPDKLLLDITDSAIANMKNGGYSVYAPKVGEIFVTMTEPLYTPK